MCRVGVKVWHTHVCVGGVELGCLDAEYRAMGTEVA